MSRTAPIFKHERTTLERLEKFVSKEYFTDCNLQGRLYGEEKKLNQILHLDCGQDRITFEEAKNRLKNGVKGQTGMTIGPTWSTHWFKLNFDPPSTWADKKVVHLIWDTGSEAMIWSSDGCPLQGLSGDSKRTDFRLHQNLDEIYIEVACNSIFGAGNNGFINPPDPNKTFTLKTAKLAVFREEIYQLLMDFDVLIGVVKQIQQDNPKRYETLHFANSLVNQFVDEPSVLQRMHDDATNFLRQNKENGKNFQIHAVGNCHIDTAWLWTYDETKRKCARSWATSVALMEQYPNLLRFACSQAQQLEWVKENYPSLFQKLILQAKQQRFIPIGGCWVEMDGNLPGGESFVRQILYGQKFFMENFGNACAEFWLPDTFGYSAQLPQLLALGGMKRFVTQKLSWNLVNKFPHNTFWWRGIDGTRVLSHFPPGDNYCMQVTVEDTLKTVNNFRDKGRSNGALMLYGHGDGGGGPDRDMLERLIRLQNVPGCPDVVASSPSEFFESVERTDLQNLCTWDGELYLELHNGTYTTHAALKKMNRQCEFLLRDCEFLSVVNYLSSKGKLYRSFEKEWKKVLLNQFHDVLPGTSIGQVIKEARQIHSDVVNECEKYLAEGKNSMASEPFFLNSMQWARIVDEEPDDKIFYVKPFSVSSSLPDGGGDGQESYVSVTQNGSNFVLENCSLRAIFNEIGQLISLRTKRSGKENDTEENFSAAAGEHADDSTGRHLDLIVDDGERRYGNTFVIFDDVPLFWDAWDVMDYHLETRKELKKSKITTKILSNKRTKVSIVFEIEISSKSFIRQEIVLRPFRSYLEFHTTVDWNESHKMLKVEFPVNVRTTKATYEIQFGHIERPTHRNTSWDSAKFEVCAQKWADLSEFDAGLALINGGKYGYSCSDNVLTLSLLRSPKAPDANTDMETHQFSYAVMPHDGPLQNCYNGRWGRNVIQSAYEFNSTVRRVYPIVDSIFLNEPIFSLESPNVVIESFKISECRNGIIVRMYESYGTKCVATFCSRYRFQEAHVCNLLETSTERISESDQRVRLFFKPFQIVSLLLIFNFSD